MVALIVVLTAGCQHNQAENIFESFQRFIECSPIAVAATHQ